ncbi:MAG: hypothetical protein HYX41_05585 [Bdellovibrio sp.]|nr:hypothetical protein [Bdellovibrio sp.]
MEKMSQNQLKSGQSDSPKNDIRPEEEHTGSIWSHPYMVYIVLTVVLFVGLLIIGWFAYSGGWIPSRSS